MLRQLYNTIKVFVYVNSEWEVNNSETNKELM